jgi:PCO_ADO
LATLIVRICAGYHSRERLAAVAVAVAVVAEPYSVYVEPIHSRIYPVYDDSVVRYIHISDVPDHYSVGIFILPPFAKIPLHDHPGMCVLSRILYGDVERLSFDLCQSDNEDDEIGDEWPIGTQKVCRQRTQRLSAPMATQLFPYQGNLHEFTAGPRGAAVLDILLPPYDVDHHRDCTFYTIVPDQSSSETFFIIPTGQPEEFHCLSGVYRSSDKYEES